MYNGTVTAKYLICLLQNGKYYRITTNAELIKRLLKKQSDFGLYSMLRLYGLNILDCYGSLCNRQLAQSQLSVWFATDFKTPISGHFIELN